MKIVMINHTFQEERFYKRWKLMAQAHPDLDVTLLAPAEWTWGDQPTLTYGTATKEKGCALDEGNFHIRLIDIKKHKFRTYSSDMLKDVLCDIAPDMIYFIGVHNYETILDIISIRNKWLPKSKVLVFSMRGKYHTLKIRKCKNPVRYLLRVAHYWYSKYKLARLNKQCDAIFCHYPEGMEEFRKEGYKGPIYMQTQVGVDIDIFHPDAEAREKIRKKYGIGDAYLFGSASRFNASKGLSEIIAALPAEGNWKYLMMGHGRDDEVAKIKSEIAARGLEDKIILTGYIDNWKDMAEHWNALDCAVHTPLTTPAWEETFSLALVQAMATGLPVIGSSSGSVPYQIGPNGIVLPEGDIEKLHDRFVYMIEHPDEGRAIGEKMFERATKCFDIRPLDELFYKTIVDIQNGVHDERKTDMVAYYLEEK